MYVKAQAVLQRQLLLELCIYTFLPTEDTLAHHQIRPDVFHCTIAKIISICKLEGHGTVQGAKLGNCL